MAAIPGTVQIGPVTYHIVTDKPLTDASGCWGRITYGDQMIRLDPDQAPDHMAITVLHEILHGIWVTGSLAGFGDSEENLVSALAIALIDLMRRNPDLLPFLLAEES